MKKLNNAPGLNAAFVLFITVFSHTSHADNQPIDDPKARKVMEAVDNRYDGDSRESTMQMLLIDRKGNKRERSITFFSKDFGEDTYSIMFFMSPADVKGTGFLTYDYQRIDDDQWIYLPALRKTKRIASKDKSASFMGSDFNYSDMTRRELDDYYFQIIKEDNFNGHKIWVIEATPKTKDVENRTGYKKELLLVRQDNHVVIRGIYWASKGVKMKYMDTLGLELIDDIWTSTKVSMTTKEGGEFSHQTTLTFSRIKYNQEMSDTLFTIRQLEQ